MQALNAWQSPNDLAHKWGGGGGPPLGDFNGIISTASHISGVRISGPEFDRHRRGDIDVDVNVDVDIDDGVGVGVGVCDDIDIDVFVLM